MGCNLIESFAGKDFEKVIEDKAMLLLPSVANCGLVMDS